MLDQAFNALLSRHSRPAILKRIGVTTVQTNIRIAPSNFVSNAEGPADVTIKGREFVISKASIVAPFTPILKKGDKIVDTELGSMAIGEIKEMYDMGGAIIGYRIRCE